MTDNKRAENLLRWAGVNTDSSPKGVQEQPTSISGQPSLCTKCGNHSIVVRYERAEILQKDVFAFWCTTCKRWDRDTRKYTGQPLIGIENVTIHIGTPVCPRCNTITMSMLSQPGDIPQDGLDYLDHSEGWNSQGTPAWYCQFCRVYVPNVKDDPVTEQPTSISEPVTSNDAPPTTEDVTESAHPEPAHEIGPTPQYPHTGSGILYWEDTWHVVHVIDDMEHLLLRYMAGLSVDQKDVRRLLKQSTRLQRRAKKALDCGL